jgi:NADH dehydrogenase (ubiquinone) flavoprotein 2
MSAPANLNVKQPKSFAFNADNMAQVNKIIAKFPAGRQTSAVIPLLDLAQRQHQNWLPIAAMDHVAELLGMPPVKVYEVASFYTMFNRAPVGKHLLQLCTTTPCWLSGSDALLKVCKDKLGIEPGESSKDGKFSLMEVECLGACVNAPMIQINDDFFEDLNAENFSKILDDLAAGKKPKVGSQIGRQGAAKAGQKK